MKKQRLFVLAIVAMLLIAVFLAACQTKKNEAQAVTPMRQLRVDHDATILGYLTVGNGAPSTAQTEGSESFYVEGTFEADGAADLDGTANIAGNVTLGGLLITGSADETITDGETITPTVTFMNLDSGSEVTMTIAACSNDGQPLYLAGDDGNTININATNLQTTDGNALAINQYDILGFMCVDTEWLLMFESNNQ